MDKSKIEIDIKDEDLEEEDFTSEELEDEDVDWKAKAQELKGIAKRRATQLGKAKTKLGEQEEKIQKLTPKEKTEEEPKPQDKIENSQSNEPDYAKLAFLEQRGVKNPDDIKLVQEEAERLKLPLTDVLGMEHIKAKLKTNNDEREAQAGMPKGKGDRGGTSQQDADYWIAKGELPDDQKLAEKVIEAKMAKDDSKKMFDDSLE